MGLLFYHLFLLGDCSPGSHATLPVGRSPPLLVPIRSHNVNWSKISAAHPNPSICVKDLSFERDIGTVGLQSAVAGAALLYSSLRFSILPFFSLNWLPSHTKHGIK